MHLQLLATVTARLLPGTAAWEEWAACRRSLTGVFYADAVGEETDARRAREAEAKRICAGCLVRAECLDYALRVGERLGVWGGLTGAERRQLQ